MQSTGAVICTAFCVRSVQAKPSRMPCQTAAGIAAASTFIFIKKFGSTGLVQAYHSRRKAPDGSIGSRRDGIAREMALSLPKSGFYRSQVEYGAGKATR